MMLKRYLFVGLVSLLFVPVALFSKPMPSPTKDEAMASRWIVIATYMGYEEYLVDKIDYFNGVMASYEVVEIIKNGPFSKNIKIHYEFDNGSACIAPQYWNFDKASMPIAGSKWILFLTRQGEKQVYMTYRGDYGRWKATEENIAAIKKAVRMIERD